MVNVYITNWKEIHPCYFYGKKLAKFLFGDFPVRFLYVYQRVHSTRFRWGPMKIPSKEPLVIEVAWDVPDFGVLFHVLDMWVIYG